MLCWPIILFMVQFAFSGFLFEYLFLFWLGIFWALLKFRTEVLFHNELNTFCASFLWFFFLIGRFLCFVLWFSFRILCKLRWKGHFACLTTAFEPQQWLRVRLKFRLGKDVLRGSCANCQFADRPIRVLTTFRTEQLRNSVFLPIVWLQAIMEVVAPDNSHKHFSPIEKFNHSTS